MELNDASNLLKILVDVCLSRSIAVKILNLQIICIQHVNRTLNSLRAKKRKMFSKLKTLSLLFPRHLILLVSCSFLLENTIFTFSNASDFACFVFIFAQTFIGRITQWKAHFSIDKLYIGVSRQLY